MSPTSIHIVESNGLFDVNDVRWLDVITNINYINFQLFTLGFFSKYTKNVNIRLYNSDDPGKQRTHSERCIEIFIFIPPNKLCKKQEELKTVIVGEFYAHLLTSYLQERRSNNIQCLVF